MFHQTFFYVKKNIHLNIVNVNDSHYDKKTCIDLGS